MVWRRESGRRIFRKRTVWRLHCALEPSGSTATTSSTRRCRLVATSSRDGDARWAKTFSRFIPRPSRCARGCSLIASRACLKQRPRCKISAAFFVCVVYAWWLRCCFLLIGRDEGLGDKGFELCRRCVDGGTGFQCAHVPGVQGACHLQDQAGHVVGDSHLHHRGSNLIAGRLDVL